jgi:photosystem II Psb27 protein
MASSAVLQLNATSVAALHCPNSLVSRTSFSSSPSLVLSLSASKDYYKPTQLVPICAARTSSDDDAAMVGASVSRRVSLLGGGSAGLLLVAASLVVEAGEALADGGEDYKNETQQVIDQVKATLELEKTDPRKADAVASLRLISNDWVAKYRRDKKVAGKPSFSNMYSVVNAIAGHYISFGPTYPIPVKRKDRILDEVKDAEKALSRGR